MIHQVKFSRTTRKFCTDFGGAPRENKSKRRVASDRKWLSVFVFMIGSFKQDKTLILQTKAHISISLHCNCSTYSFFDLCEVENVSVVSGNCSHGHAVVSSINGSALTTVMRYLKQIHRIKTVKICKYCYPNGKTCFLYRPHFPPFA